MQQRGFKLPVSGGIFAAFLVSSFLSGSIQALPPFEAGQQPIWEMTVQPQSTLDNLQRAGVAFNTAALENHSAEIAKKDEHLGMPVLVLRDVREEATPSIKIDLSEVAPSVADTGTGAVLIEFRALDDSGKSLSGRFLFSANDLRKEESILNVALLGTKVLINREREMVSRTKLSKTAFRVVVNFYASEGGEPVADVALYDDVSKIDEVQGLPLRHPTPPRSLTARAGWSESADGRGLAIAKIQVFSRPLPLN
jgi:hypothetical protein